MTDASKPVVLVTGCTGLIGSRIVDRIRNDYSIVGFDLEPMAGELAQHLHFIHCDLTESDSVARAIESLRDECGSDLASVIHLAAYYDFSGEPSPLYRELTVEGTERLLHQLQTFHVEQFVFASSLLVMESADDDQPIAENSPVDAEWDYPMSKLAAERVICEKRGAIPAVILRIAGVYDEDCHSVPLSQQISRIYERQLEGFFFPGDKEHGQAFVHLVDVAECFHQTVLRRKDLGEHEVFLIGEEDVMSYADLQEEMGKLIHASEWPTFRIPKAIAKAGAWVKDKLADEGDKPFIKPWMIDLADQNYPLNIRKARQQLRWEPRHTLRNTLPEMIGRLYHDTRRWYEINNLEVPEATK